jgi:plasmid replication initiation protein
MELKNKDKCSFSLKIKSIREKLELEDRYTRFFDFKKRVLESAKKEINKHSDINFNYKIIKLGRFPNEIEFTISKKQKNLISYQNNHKKLTPLILEEAKKIVLKSGTGWDLYAIEQQFYDYTNKKGLPDNLEAAFLGFVRKKVATPP